MRISVLLSCVLFAATAQAEWRDAGVPGTPKDVQVWRPGDYSVSTQLEARLFQADGGTQVVPGDSAGTWLTPEGCLVSVSRSGSTLMGASCQLGAGSVFGDTRFNARRVRHDETGAGFVVSMPDGTNGSRLAFSEKDAGSINSWSHVLLPDTINPGEALGVMHQGTGSHALICDNARGLFAWYIGTMQANVIQPMGASIPPATSIDLFNGGGSAPTALFGTASGLYRLELGSSLSPFSAVQLPTGSDRVAGVDMNVGAGSARADGFGMAVVQGDGGSVVLSAVPTDNPSKVGTAWQVNPTFPSGLSGYGSARLRHVSCVGAESCVITVEQDGGSNLLVYRNAHAPQILAPQELSVKEGQSTSQFVPAVDVDGDAVLATAAGFSEGPLTVTASGAAGGVSLQFNAGTVCDDYTVGRMLNLFASDGLASHERDAGISVKVLHTRPPATPGIAPEVLVPAGTGPRTLQATRVNGCLPKRYTWTALGGAPALAEGGGATATFETPAVACAEQRFLYQVRGSDDAGTSDAGEVAVVLQPWGEPSAAFVTPDARRELIAGQPVRVEPESFHPCATTNTFPGVRTVWRLADGGTLPLPGVRVRTPTGEELSSADVSVTGPHLVVSTDDCIDTQVPLTAYHRTLDTEAVRGPDSTVNLEVKTRLAPLSQGTLGLVPSTSTPGARLTGTADVQGLNCLARRPGLQARLQVLRQDGSEVGSPQTAAVPGPWTLDLEEGCSGGSFRIRGRLLDASGSEVGGAGEAVVTTRRLDAALGALARNSALVARCGEGARGTLVQTIPPEACSTPRISWAQVDGPALAAATFSGPTLDVATRETGLDALVGQRVRMRVTAQAAPDNVVVREHEVPISVAPFVDVRHETEKPTSSESGLLGVSASLRNTTSCGVTGVLLEERLVGMEYVPGSARLDGQPVDVEVSGGLLRLGGVELGGNAVRRFTYVARPGLLGTPGVKSQVFLRQVPISQDVPPPPDGSGCGCSSGSSGAAAFGLAALGLALRRRRRA